MIKRNQNVREQNIREQLSTLDYKMQSTKKILRPIKFFKSPFPSKIDETLRQPKNPELYSTGVWRPAFLLYVEREKGEPVWLAHSP